MRRQLCWASLALYCCWRLWCAYSRVRASVRGPSLADPPSWNVVPIAPNKRSGESGRTDAYDTIARLSIFEGER